MLIDRFNADKDELKETLPLTEDLCFAISQANSYLSATQVRQYLIAGLRIYTSFSYYQKSEKD